jgi:hypothetical protein
VLSLACRNLHIDWPAIAPALATSALSGRLTPGFHEITEQVVGARRLSALRDLGPRSGEAKTAEDACVIAARTLAGHPEDVPFALFYLLNGDRKPPAET